MILHGALTSGSNAPAPPPGNYCTVPNLTSVSRLLFLNVYEVALFSMFWAPKALEEFPEHLDWPIDNGFVNRPMMRPTQILVHRWGPEQGFWSCFADGLNKSLVSSVAHAGYYLQEIALTSFC